MNVESWYFGQRGWPSFG